jgi:hypothetical protein
LTPELYCDTVSGSSTTTRHHEEQTVALDFQAWPSIPRLNREMVVTEKIDGTNAAIIIESHGVVPKDDAPEYMARHEEAGDGYSTFRQRPAVLCGPEIIEWPGMVEVFEIGSQSRKRLIKPGDDNFGFAGWVFANADRLLDALGEGRHYGEWWGSGIQRGYDLEKGEKRFSLFNVKRYGEIDFAAYHLPNVATVPVLWRGPFDLQVIDSLIEELRRDGSFVNGLENRFHNPEGVVVYHTASNSLFKVLCENDDIPKSLVGAGTGAVR